MAFSYNAVWNDTMAMLRAQGSLIGALAGVFLFLPSLLLSYFVPTPEGEPTAAAMLAFAEANLHWYVITGLVAMVGAIAILTLVLRRDGLTVGGAIGRAIVTLPFYLLAVLIARLVIALGFVALIVPGLYLIGRLAPIGPLVVAEGVRNPLDAFARTFRLTRNRGWAVFGLIFLVGLAGVVILVAVSSVFGILAAIAAGGVAKLLALIVNSALSAALSVVMLLLFAAIYRTLSSPA